MRKIFNGMIVVLSVFLLAGCENPITDLNAKVDVEPQKAIEAPEPEISLKEGKYIQIAPSNEGSQGEGYDNYLTLENGIATEYGSYFGITTEGTYTIVDNNLTIHYTRNYGMTTYGEEFDDSIDRTIYCHIDGNKVIVDSFSDFDYYDTGSIIYELMQ